MDEKIAMQRDAFAVKACHMMGKTIEETSKVLAMNPIMVRLMFMMIEKDRVDFDAAFDD